MRKAAKVYEASESVEGAKPKVVYESHKQCAPGEFGARVKESAGSGGVLGRFLAAAATAGGAGAALNSAAKKRPAPVTPAPTIAENALSRRREIEGLLRDKANSAREFGEKLAATPGGMFGKALKTVSGVGNAAKSLARSPQAAGREAMLAARRNLKPSTWNGATSPDHAWALGQQRLLSNPGYTNQINRVHSELRNVGVDHNMAARMADETVPRFIPRREALLSAGSQAANKHIARQMGVYGAGAVGVTALDNAVRAHMNRPQPMVNPAMENLFKGIQPAAQPADAATTPEETGMIKTESAREFGQKVAFNIDLSMLKNPAMGGAALGAGLGGLSGLIAPGTDENGKTRSRFGALLRGALGGGAVGGLGGAAGAYLGQYDPDYTQKLTKGVNAGRMMTDPANYREMSADLQGKTFPPQMRIPTDVRRMYNASQYGHDFDLMASYYATLAGSKPQQQ